MDWVTPSPYDSAEWSDEDWKGRESHIRLGTGQLGQHIQLSVLSYHSNEFFARTGEYVCICEEEVKDVDCNRQWALKQLLENPPELRRTPKLRATPNPTEVRPPSPTSVIDVQQAAEHEPTPRNIPALTAILTQNKAQPKL